MKTGLRFKVVNGGIEYEELRKVNAEVARRAVLEYMKTSHSISATARMFGITRAVVYDILKKEKSGDLTDRPRVPKHQPRKTEQMQ